MFIYGISSFLKFAINTCYTYKNNFMRSRKHIGGYIWPVDWLFVTFG